MGSPPFSLDGPDWQRLPAVLKAELNAPTVYARPDGSPCSWLTQDGTCRHYHLRPDICREFRRGGFACREWRVEIGLSVLSERGAA